jgi:hypothetical protein
VGVLIATRIDNEIVDSTLLLEDDASLIGSVRNGTLYADGDEMVFALTIDGEELVGVPMIAGQARISRDATGIAGTLAGVIRTSDAQEIADRLSIDASLYVSGACEYVSDRCSCPDQLSLDWAAVLQVNEFCGSEISDGFFDQFGPTDVSVGGITGVSFAIGFHAIPL